MDSPLASMGRGGKAKDSVKVIEDCPDRAGLGSTREHWRTPKAEANMQLQRMWINVTDYPSHGYNFAPGMGVRR